MGYRLHMVALILVMAFPVFSGTCPTMEDISPCSCSGKYDVQFLECSNVDISLTNLSQILYEFDKKISLYVHLNKMKIKSIPSDFFYGSNIISLRFSKCMLDNLAEGGGQPLSGLMYTLEDLTIEHSFSNGTILKKLDLSHLKQLLDLKVLFNDIPELGNDWFAYGPSQLDTLTLVGNGIRRIGDRAFANLLNLETLWINGNGFGQIRRSMLPNPAPHLKILRLENNDLANLPENLFIEMPNLYKVSLGKNKFTQIPEASLQVVWSNLKYIDLTGNPLDCASSSIQWMVKAKSRVEILGTCQSPSYRKGMNLKDLIDRIRAF